MKETLHAWSNGDLLGAVEWDRRADALSFRYDESWRASAGSFPLSLSMPMTSASHGDAAVRSYLWGLLPDNDGVLQRWGERFHVSPRNPFRILWHVGEDCAGAVQLVTDARLEEWRSNPRRGRIQWLNQTEVAERIDLLLRDHSATRTGNDRGHFSLAGAQPKIALIRDDDGRRWGIPSGTTPTTHILKPATGAFDGLAENEHFCMELARELGLSTAASRVEKIGSNTVIVIDRFDRMRSGRQWLRIHQEDMCQALARPPQQKYQNQGGPSAAEILGLIGQYSSDRTTDARRFVDALKFNWLIAGTDAHAKNYAFLLGTNGQTRLAPLYDLSSALPYFPQQIDPRRATLAMKIGGKYRLRDIGEREWRNAAQEWQVDAGDLFAQLRTWAAELPSIAESVRKRLHQQGLRHPVLRRITDALKDRCTH